METKKNKGQRASEALAIGNKRIKLLDMYGLNEQPDKKGLKKTKTKKIKNKSASDLSSVIVDTAVYLETLCSLVREGKQVSLPVSGGSMLPFLAGTRDSVLLSAPEGRLKKGDIYLYQRRSGQFVLHRLYRIKNGRCYFIGDAQTVPEGPLSQEQIRAKVVAAVRKGKQITPANLIWKFYRSLWIRMIPLRPAVIRLVSVLKKGLR